MVTAKFLQNLVYDKEKNWKEGITSKNMFDAIGCYLDLLDIFRKMNTVSIETYLVYILEDTFGFKPNKYTIKWKHFLLDNDNAFQITVKGFDKPFYIKKEDIKNINMYFVLSVKNEELYLIERKD